MPTISETLTHEPLPSLVCPSPVMSLLLGLQPTGGVQRSGEAGLDERDVGLDGGDVVLDRGQVRIVRVKQGQRRLQPSQEGLQLGSGLKDVGHSRPAMRFVGSPKDGTERRSDRFPGSPIGPPSRPPPLWMEGTDVWKPVVRSRPLCSCRGSYCPVPTAAPTLLMPWRPMGATASMAKLMSL